MKLPFYALLLGLLAYSPMALSQSLVGINYSTQNTVYTQNFDGLPASGSFSLTGKGPIALNTSPINGNNLIGWQLMMISGSGLNANFLVGTGSGTASGSYSFGVSNSTDRALGSLASSTGIYAVGIILTNSTGTNLNTASISLIAKQFRRGGSGNKNTWKCRYKTGSFSSIDQPGLTDEPLLNFESVQTSTSVATLNGHLPENQMNIHHTLQNIDWKNGEQLLIRWDDADETGSDDAMAIDQFNFSAKYNTPNPININNIQSLSNNPTNADTIQYAIKLGGNLTGLSTSNFELKSSGLSETKMVAVTGAGNDYTIKVYSGKGEGYMQLGIINNNNLIPGLQGLPYFDIDTQWIDKIGPTIQKISIPNQLMKGGDTIPILIQIKPEKTAIQLVQGNINNYPIQPIKKETDSTYRSYFILPLNGNDIQAKDPIPVSIILQDSLGNKTDPYNLPIEENNDPIDFNKPIQLGFNSISDTLLRAGDTLKLVIQFNEPVLLDANTPSNFIPVTIGSRVKNIVYNTGNNSTSLQFQYIIQPGEIDKDGIRIASSFSAKNLLIKDIAGNPASLIIQSASIQHIKIDAIAPEFSNSKDTSVIICASGVKQSINELLKANNKEINEILTWQLEDAPKSVLINKTIYQQSSTASSIQPVDFFVENRETFKGIDSATFSLSDGINTVLKKIKFNFIAVESTNWISPNQEICNGSIPALISGSSKSIKDSAAVYLWEQSTVADSTGFMAAIGKNNEMDYQPVAQSKPSWWRRKITLNGCSTVSNTVRILIAKNSQWTGKTSTDWNNPGNWCGNTIPADTADAVIPTGTIYTPIITNAVSVRNLTIHKGASIIVNAVLSITDQISTDSVAINALNGTIAMNGSNQQILNGTIFENNRIGILQINNPAGVNINKHIIITKLLTLSKGTLFTNNQLTLAHKAMVGPSANGTAINGIVTVEQNFTTYKNGKYLIGHPFNQSISINQISLTPNLYYQTQSNNQDSTHLLKNWQAFNLNTSSENNLWKPYQGIQLHIASDNATASLKSEFKGILNHGLQEINLYKLGNNGLNIIANPFVSPIQLNAVSKGSMVGNHFWIWNPKQGMNGGYTAIPSTQQYTLNPFEAFIAEVRNTDLNTIVIAEESKTNTWNNSNTISYSANNQYHVTIGLYSGNVFWDQFVLIDHGSSRNGLDSTDAIKLQNPDVNLFSTSTDQQILSVDARRINNNTVVPIQLVSNTNQSFYLKINQAFLPTDNKLVLHDRLTNQYLPLQKDSIYAFAIDPDSIKNKNRFEISQLIPKGNINRLIHYLTVKIFPNPVLNELSVGIKSSIAANTSIQIFSNAGVLIKSINVGNIQAGTIQIPVAELNAGTYIVQVISGEHQRSLNFIKQ